MNQFRWVFCHLIDIDILHPSSKFKKKSQEPFLRKLTKCQFLGNFGPKKGPKRGTQCINRHGTFTIRQILMSPFIVPSLKKIVGAKLEKINKVDFRDIQTDIHTYGHTYYSDLIGPFPSGVQNDHYFLNRFVFRIISIVWKFHCPKICPNNCVPVSSYLPSLLRYIPMKFCFKQDQMAVPSMIKANLS